MDGARENPDRLLESSLLFGGLAGRQIFVSIHFCCLFIIFMGVHPLTFFLCFVGERLRPSPGLRPRGEEGRQAAATAVLAAASDGDFDWGKFAFALAMLALAGFLSFIGK
jgi:hypothetical protein